MRVLAGIVLGLAGLVVTQHAVAEHSRARASREAVAKLVADLSILPTEARTDVHATINGVVTHLVFGTGVPACGDDDVVPTSDAPSRRFTKVAVEREDAADGSASAVLCVFRDVDGTRYERLTFVRGESSVSLTRESAVDLATMFPLEGDAPGADLVGVPRPTSSRRVVTASVAETAHTVVAYETPESEESFTARMRGVGFVAFSEASGVRLYGRGDERIVVVFGAGRMLLAKVRRPI